MAENIMLKYSFVPDYENNNKVSAALATYDDAIAQVRDYVVKFDGREILETVPASGSSVYFLDVNAEGWYGTVLVWGRGPLEISELPQAGPEMILRIDGVLYRIGYREE